MGLINNILWLKVPKLNMKKDLKMLRVIGFLKVVNQCVVNILKIEIIEVIDFYF